MRNRTSVIVTVFLLYPLFLMLADKSMVEAEEHSKIYIAYLGEKKYASKKLTTESHHALLATILGSKEKTSESMVYSYRHGFSGFAAKLTKSQAQKLAEMPEVVRFIPNTLYKLQTTRSWDFLGLSSSHSHSNLLHRANMGDGVIIGVIDSGIWPESESFSDEGLGPVPARWKGICQSGDQFNSTNCNRKIIGARWYLGGLETSNRSEIEDYLSPRDLSGHGTHAASTAAGSFVKNVSYRSLGFGTVRGGAPRARLAIYKVCWTSEGQCWDADILKAIDQAIHDGVDVLSLSLVKTVPMCPEFDENNIVTIGSFHATVRGITVVFAGGNEGPSAQTVVNIDPWVLTVAASSMDRVFLASITLGDNNTFLGQSFFSGKKIESSLTYAHNNDIDPNTAGFCEGILANNTSTSGKVVLCFSRVADVTTVENAFTAVISAKGVGLIVAGEHDDILFSCGDLFPCVVVDSEIGTQILLYIKATSNAKVKLSTARTIVGKPISPHIAYFSSRGPNSVASAILKPDIAAPGESILAATSPHDLDSDNGYTIKTGTSMATPHISGIVALLKSIHPTWSPSAIKSALVTTAWNTQASGLPILAAGSPLKVADPFDYGGGIVNPNGAGNPGLIYDMTTKDYIYYLCSMGYNNSAISLITEKTHCPNPKPSILDLNLPSITIPTLINSTTITRTVTNVGNSTSIYKAFIQPPPGTKVEVQPNVLIFNSNVTKITFKVTISTALQRNYGYSFGSISWSDGVYVVKSPLSIRMDFLYSSSSY